MKNTDNPVKMGSFHEKKFYQFTFPKICRQNSKIKLFAKNEVVILKSGKGEKVHAN